MNGGAAADSVLAAPDEGRTPIGLIDPLTISMD